MGWLYNYSWTLKSLIAERTKDWSHTFSKNELLGAGITVTTTCVAKCFRGNVCYKGTLWVVWERTFANPDGSVAKAPERWIGCDLMQRSGGDWGYKDLDESCGPYYYNCPEKYLNMVPEVANQEWRDAVAEHHKLRRAKRAKRKLVLA